MENILFNSKKEEKKDTKINCFSSIFDRESERFLDCMEDASTDIIKDIYNKHEFEFLEYDTLREIHNLCEIFTKIGFIFIEKHLSNLFKKNKKEIERSPYDIYSSGIRKVVTHLSNSYLVKKIVPLFKLGNVLDVVEIHKNQTADFLKYLEFFSNSFEKYATNLDKGSDIAKDLDKNANNGEKDYSSEMLTRLYATLKTWTTDEEFNTFIDNFEKFLDTGIELTIVSPFELYLKLGKEEIIVIWKMLTALSQNEITDKLKLEDSIEFSNHLYDSIKKEMDELGILYEVRRLFKETVKNYINDFKKNQESLRSLVKNKNERKDFIEKFEKGGIFYS